MIKPGLLTLPQAGQLNDLLNFHQGLINSAGTGDMAFSVGEGGLTTAIVAPKIQIVQVVNDVPSLDQRYDAQIVTYDESTNTYSTSGNQGTSPVWLREANQSLLASGEYYVALGTGFNQDYLSSGGLYGIGRSVYTTSIAEKTQELQVQVLTTQVNTSGRLEASSGAYVTTSGWYSGLIQSYVSGQYQLSGCTLITSGAMSGSYSNCYCWFLDNNGRQPVSGHIYNVDVVATDASGVLVVAGDTWTPPLQVQVLTTKVNTSGYLFNYVVTSGTSSGMTSGVYTSGWYSGLVQNYVSGQYQSGGNTSGNFSYVWWLDNNGRVPVSGWLYNCLQVGHDVSGVPICAAETWATSPQVQVLTTTVSHSGILFITSGTVTSGTSSGNANGVYTSGWYSGLIQAYSSGKYQSGNANSGTYCWFLDTNGVTPTSGWIYNTIQVAQDASGVAVCAAQTWTLSGYTVVSGVYTSGIPALLSGNIFADLISLPQASVDLVYLTSGSVPTIAYVPYSIPQNAYGSGSITSYAYGQYSIPSTAYGQYSIPQNAYASGSITYYAYASGSINTYAYASGSITSEIYAAGSIPTTALSPGIITSGYLGSGAVTSGTLASGAIQVTAAQGGVIITTSPGNFIFINTAFGLTNVLY